MRDEIGGGFNIQPDKTELTGEDYFIRYLSGDDEAFESLVAIFENELFLFIYKIVNDYHEAKHLAIESFANLAAGGKKFAHKSSIKTYLFTIGKNLAYKYVKQRGKERHISFEELTEPLTADNESETPDGYLALSENKRLLRETMLGLKEEHYAVLVLLYFEDMSYLQAGRAMGKSEKQVKHLAFRAKAALKKKLERGGYVH